MKPTYIIVHHSGGTDANHNEDTSNQTVIQINAWHKERGFPLSSLGYYVGYQYVIEKDGTTIQCRKDDEIGAHTVGMNDRSIGICLVGNFDLTLPTESQKTALTALLKEKMAQWSILSDNIVPHRHFVIKSCYGSRLSDGWARDLVTPTYVKIIDAVVGLFFPVGRAVNRVVINKETGESYPVLGTTFGQEEVIFTTRIGDIVFENKGAVGDLQNNNYLVKEI